MHPLVNIQNFEKSIKKLKVVVKETMEYFEIKLEDLM